MHVYARHTIVCDFSISALAYYNLFVAVSMLAVFNLMSVSSTSVAGVCACAAFLRFRRFDFMSHILLKAQFRVA